jgi:hypothetical protein
MVSYQQWSEAMRLWNNNEGHPKERCDQVAAYFRPNRDMLVCECVLLVIPAQLGIWRSAGSFKLLIVNKMVQYSEID